MPDATGLNALLRQTGGSVGLAVFATVLTRYATRMRGAMLSSVTMSRPEVMARVQSVQSMLAGRGLDPLAAQSTARRMIDLQVRQQAMVLAFEKLFMLSGICFLCVLPLVFLLRAPKGAAEVHVEM
jgi:DHA2 family multidrug resistance protein